MKIEYVVADPGGNVTILVLNPVKTALHSTAAKKLLQLHAQAEQVGYLTMGKNESLRVDMMGGEFCGNASRAAAACAAMLEGREKGEYNVSCSGCGSILTAHAASSGQGVYSTYIEMPMPEAVEAVLVDAGGMPSRFYRVDLPGIVHFVHFVNDIDHIDKNVFWDAVYAYAKDDGYEAFGLILFDPTQLRMIPAVYVSGTETLYWENSCGSGSAAAAAVLAILGKRDVSCTIKQPGGAISIAATVEAKELTHLYIGGSVILSERKSTEIDV